MLDDGTRNTTSFRFDMVYRVASLLSHYMMYISWNEELIRDLNVDVMTMCVMSYVDVLLSWVCTCTSEEMRIISSGTSK